MGFKSPLVPKKCKVFLLNLAVTERRMDGRMDIKKALRDSRNQQAGPGVNVLYDTEVVGKGGFGFS